MAGHSTLSEIAALAAALSPEERRNLAETILRDLSTENSNTPQRHLWRDIRGSLSVYTGEDAQTWVSRTRRESDEHRRSDERNGA